MQGKFTHTRLLCSQGRTNGVTNDSRLVRVSALAAKAACVLSGLCLFRQETKHDTLAS